MAGGAFDKDFGYLMPFLDKVTAAAGSLADEAARVELRRLMAGEKQRWERIRELLAEARSDSTTPAQATPSNASNSQARSSEEPTAPAFTVGSLRHNS